MLPKQNKQDRWITLKHSTRQKYLSYKSVSFRVFYTYSFENNISQSFEFLNISFVPLLSDNELPEEILVLGTYMTICESLEAILKNSNKKKLGQPVNVILKRATERGGKR